MSNQTHLQDPRWDSAQTALTDHTTTEEDSNE
jgi:hypothetical protein